MKWFLQKMTDEYDKLISETLRDDSEKESPNNKSECWQEERADYQADCRGTCERVGCLQTIAAIYRDFGKVLVSPRWE